MANHNRVTLVVLCEDEFHQLFVSAFLNRLDLPRAGRPRIERKQGKAGVLAAFATEVRAVRRATVATRLLVLVDGDQLTDAEIESAFRAKLVEAELEPDYSADPVAVLVPRWELENWALALLGEPMDEVRDQASRKRVGDRGREAARLLADACRAHDLPASAPPSLILTCERWNAFRARFPI